jgi:membrane-bound ClpP family serine protease
MASQLERTLKQEKAILKTSPWTRAIVALVFLVFGVLLLAVDVASPGTSRVGAAGGTCFAITAIAFVAYREAIQSKVNLEIAKAIQALRGETGKTD